MSVSDVNVLLKAWSGGDESALARLTPLVYDELHRLAVRYLRQERPDHTLQATALIHEAYLKLLQQKSEREWNGRAHFLAVAALQMRAILVDHARARLRAKRGSGAAKLPLEELENLPLVDRDEELLALDEALAALARVNPLHARLVEMRFFSGMTIEETAQVLNLSVATVKRHWTLARGWLQRYMQAGEVADGG